MKVQVEYVESNKLQAYLQTYADLGVPVQVVGVESYKPVFETVSERGGSAIRRLDAQAYCVILRKGE